METIMPMTKRNKICQLTAVLYSKLQQIFLALERRRSFQYNLSSSDAGSQDVLGPHVNRSIS